MARYTVNPVRGEQLLDEINDELRGIEEGLNSSMDLEISRQVERPRPGMVRYFDASVYDPGSGTGYYGYTGGAWVKFH